ncbi:MAG: hypothetical protein U5K76_11810 [Woeseiaceae bacterium]|nr:hypothetical protein [Woeseiaceae bacterium]
MLLEMLAEDVQVVDREVQRADVIRDPRRAAIADAAVPGGGIQPVARQRGSTGVLPVMCRPRASAVPGAAPPAASTPRSKVQPSARPRNVSAQRSPSPSRPRVSSRSAAANSILASRLRGSPRPFASGAGSPIVASASVEAIVTRSGDGVSAAPSPSGK